MFVVGVAGVFASAEAKTCPYLEDSELGTLCIADGYIDCQNKPDKSKQKEMLYEYIVARESYDPTVFQSQWNKVWMYSSDALFNEYKANFTSEDMRYYVQIMPETIEDLQVTLLNSGRCDRPVAQVRFQKITTMQDRIEKKPYIATIEYLFLRSDKETPYSEQNPTGFKVLSYRTDEEISQR